MKILVLDNHDSFVYNLVHYLQDIDDKNEIFIIKNNEISLDEVVVFDKILLSPGPGLPKNAGVMPALIKKYFTSKNILGVCLGHQAIAEAFGCTLKNLENPLHGISSKISVLDSHTIFKNCPENFKIAHYHSWVVESFENHNSLDIIALDSKKNCMALQHKNYPIFGVQFHPESILTENGKEILKNWLES